MSFLPFSEMFPEREGGILSTFQVCKVIEKHVGEEHLQHIKTCMIFNEMPANKHKEPINKFS